MEKFFRDHPEALQAFENIQSSFRLMREAHPTPLSGKRKSIMRLINWEKRRKRAEAAKKRKLATTLFQGNYRYFSELMSKRPGEYEFNGLEYYPKMIGGPAFKYYFPYEYQNLSGRAIGLSPTILGRFSEVTIPTFTITENYPPLLNVPIDTVIRIAITDSKRLKDGWVEQKVFVPWKPNGQEPEVIDLTDNASNFQFTIETNPFKHA